MANKITLTLEPRTVTGRQVKKLRQQGVVPATIFGKGITSQNVQFDLKEFLRVFAEAGETQIVYVTVGTEKAERPILVTNTQYDPVTDHLLHVDLRQVDLKEKIEAQVPVEIIGESPAVKEFNAVVVPSLSEVTVEALPTDIPEKIEVDITVLKAIGDVIHVSDLKIDTTKVEIKAEPDTIVVAVTEQQEEEEVVAPVAPTEAAAAPVAPEAKPEEAPKKAA